MVILFAVLPTIWLKNVSTDTELSHVKMHLAVIILGIIANLI